jgi:hypothetical protein
MIYIAAIVFPLLSILTGVVTLVALIRYVNDIRHDIKNQRT